MIRLIPAVTFALILNQISAIVNGKEVYNRKISPDKEFMAKVFAANSDCSPVWANRILIKVK